MDARAGGDDIDDRVHRAYLVEVDFFHWDVVDLRLRVAEDSNARTAVCFDRLGEAAHFWIILRISAQGTSDRVSVRVWRVWCAAREDACGGRGRLV